MNALELTLLGLVFALSTSLSVICGYYFGIQKMYSYYAAAVKTPSYKNPTQDDFDRLDDPKNDSGYSN